MRSSKFTKLMDALTRDGIAVSSECEEAISLWKDEALENLFLERRQVPQLTGYQRREICEGRADQLVYGEYVVRELIGSGGMADVFRANHVHMRRDHAIKVIRRELLNRLPESHRKTVIRRFAQEVRIAARLEHDHIVRTFGFDRRRHFVVMEYVDGPDLDSLSDQAELYEEDAVDLVLQAARGLEYAHNQGVVHRDIKPRNLIFDEATSRVKITDWGLARIDNGPRRHSYLSGTGSSSYRRRRLHATNRFLKRDGQAGRDAQPAGSAGAAHPGSRVGSDNPTGSRLTQPGEVFGSVCFMSPEQAEDTYQAGRQSDIYSLGCTLFTLLTRRPIYTRSTATLTLLAHCDPAVPVPSLSAERGVSPYLETVFHRMVARDLKRRYPSMREVIFDLEQCLRRRQMFVVTT